MEQKIHRQKSFVGTVVSDKMEKTRVVHVHWKSKHSMYTKPVRRLSKFKAHDEKNISKTGDTVKIIETRPLSKEKRWRITSIIKQG